MSKITKKYDGIRKTYAFLHVLAVCGPFIFFMIMGFIKAETVNKLAIPATAMVAGVFFVFSLLREKRLKCVPYIILLGIYFAIQRIEIVIIVYSISTIFDDLWFYPMYKKYFERFNISKQLDTRLENECQGKD